MTCELFQSAGTSEFSSRAPISQSELIDLYSCRARDRLRLSTCEVCAVDFAKNTQSEKYAINNDEMTRLNAVETYDSRFPPHVSRRAPRKMLYYMQWIQKAICLLLLMLMHEAVEILFLLCARLQFCEMLRLLFRAELNVQIFHP